MKHMLAAMAVGLSGLAAMPAAAETCGGTYTVRAGDSLSAIADTHYKNAGMWTAIHSANLDTIGPKPDRIAVGMTLSLACLDGLPVGLAGGVPLSNVQPTAAKIVQIQPGNAAVRKRINLLTGDDFAPFTAKAAHNGGLLTEVVQSAMTEAAPDKGFAIHWVDDWASHLEPLLSNALLDLGFPWYQPDCATTPENFRCQNFHFSDPMFELLILLFRDTARPFAFNLDTDIEGKTLCRPSGYFTFDLDQNGRRWLLDDKITLKQPRTVKDCFDMVLAGEADAVALNEFTGRAAIKEHGLADRITVVPQPLSVAGLHVVVHKSHPEAEDMLAMINDGLRGIRASGNYQNIIEDHMARIWAEF
ncbi:MAG: transporter substrate-binding domain-containing protein [Rhodobacter sp.]|nr:transporter substrate-binding domain-containing protein [Rhodobacter sp.]